MNKELYLQFRKLEKEENKILELQEKIYGLLNYQNYFKTKESEQALKKLEEYILLLKKRIREIPLFESEEELKNVCIHEIILKDCFGTTCALCRKNFPDSYEHKGIIIELENYQFCEELLNAIYRTIDYIIENDLSFEQLNEIFMEKIQQQNICTRRIVKKNLKIGRRK